MNEADDPELTWTLNAMSACSTQRCLTPAYHQRLKGSICACSAVVTAMTADSTSFAPYTFDAWNGSFSLAVWGGLIVSVAAVLLHALRTAVVPSAAHASRTRWTFAGVAKLLLYASLLVVSALVTWTPMLRMVAVDMQRSGYTAQSSGWYSLSQCMQWLTSSKQHRQHSLFFLAYQEVCRTSEAWYISSQLLLCVLSYTALLWIEGPRRSTAVAALWIGFAGAMSVSFAAFGVASVWQQQQRPQVEEKAVSASARSKKDALAPAASSLPAPSKLLWVCIVIALLSVPLLQHGVSDSDSTVPRAFKLSLILGHLALLVPFFSAAPSAHADTQDASAVRSSTSRVVLLYGFLAGLSLHVHLSAAVPLLRGVWESFAGGNALDMLRAWNSQLLHAAYSTPARESISMDVVMMYVLMTCFVAVEARGWRTRIAWMLLVGASLATAGLLLPISVLLPAFMLQQTLAVDTEPQNVKRTGSTRTHVE